MDETKTSTPATTKKPLKSLKSNPDTKKKVWSKLKSGIYCTDTKIRYKFERWQKYTNRRRKTRLFGKKCAIFTTILFVHICYGIVAEDKERHKHKQFDQD